MTTRLIVNADDYGLTAAVSHGIRQAHDRGIVSSTTCLMNQPGVADEIARARRQAPRLGLGVHLVLTAGRPLLPAARRRSLTGPDGAFWRLEQLVNRLDRLDPAEARAEWQAQIEAFVRVAGQPPTHLDAHHHSAFFTPALMQALLGLARAYDCAIRRPAAEPTRAPGDTQAGAPMAGLPEATIGAIRTFAPALLAEYGPRTTDRFYAAFYGPGATREGLLRLMAGLPPGETVELMCHPGLVDARLLAGSRYARERARELNVLTDPAVTAAVGARNIQLITFADL